MAVRDPRPGDRSVLVLFVLGGVSAVEVAEVQHQLVLINTQQARHPRSDSASGTTVTGYDIIIGSNDLLSPDDVYFHILG
jgi:hypothetical protein